MAAQTQGKHALPTSIFTDDTGRRSVRVRWAVRVVSTTLVIGVAAIALSLFTHVSLPSLGLPDPTSGSAEVKKPQQSRVPSPSATATTPPPTSATSAARRAAASDAASPTSPAPAQPTATTPSSGKAADAPSAAPSHTPGTPPPTPPGKSK